MSQLPVCVCVFVSEAGMRSGVEHMHATHFVAIGSFILNECIERNKADV